MSSSPSREGPRPRKCKQCGGSGKQKPPEWEPPRYGPGTPCFSCNGTGNENWAEIWQARFKAEIAAAAPQEEEGAPQPAPAEPPREPLSDREEAHALMVRIVGGYACFAGGHGRGCRIIAEALARARQEARAAAFEEVMAHLRSLRQGPVALVDLYDAIARLQSTRGAKP